MLFDLQIFSGGVYARAQPNAQSLFLFPIVFGINLIHFFDEKKDGAGGNSIVCFGASIPCHAIWQIEATKNPNCFEECNVFMCNGSVNSAPFQRGVRERGANFWQGKVRNSSPILRCTFWQGKVQKSSPISALLRWRHFRLTLSLSLSLSLCISLSPSAPHAQYRKRFRASYNESWPVNLPRLSSYENTSLLPCPSTAWLPHSVCSGISLAGAEFHGGKTHPWTEIVNRKVWRVTAVLKVNRFLTNQSSKHKKR